MKSKTHAMAEAITAALGPIFHANPDYKTITEAIALTVARVAQATIDRGFEHRSLDAICAMASHALTEFLNAEEAIQEPKAKVIARGIDAFAEMVPLDGDDGPAFGLAALHGDLGVEARDAAEAFAGQDHTEASWSNSPIHEEITRFEQEHPEVNNGYEPDRHNPDGPRAYL